MKIHAHDSDTMMILIERWCAITGYKYDSPVAYSAIDNLEDYIDDAYIPNDMDNPDALMMTPTRVINEYLYFMEDEDND